jgi:hypothetical protein
VIHIRPNAGCTAKLLENDLFIAYLVIPSVTQDYTVPTDQMAMNNIVNRRQINTVIVQSEVEYQRSCKGTEKNNKSVSQNCHYLV